MFLVVLLFILGAAFGSFLNVVADRSVKGLSILGRSSCDFCKRKLTSLDLIPVLGFFLLGGRCRYCRRRLSWQYPIVEMITGFLFVLVFLFLTISNQFNLMSIVYYLILVCVMVVVGIIDYKFYLIPTSFIFAASLLSLFYNYSALGSLGFIDHVIGAFAAAIFFGIIVLVTLGRGMGEGDIFLGFLIGLVLGVKMAIVAIFLAFFIGALVSIVLLMLRKKRLGEAVPFGPFLILGFFSSLFWGESLLRWYLMLY